VQRADFARAKDDGASVAQIICESGDQWIFWTYEDEVYAEALYEFD
jgi:hypothetical protein